MVDQELYYLGKAQFFLRLMGVYFAFAACIGIIGYGVNLVLDMQAEDPLYLNFSLSWLIGSIAELFVGLYLMAGGTRVLEAVFTSSPDNTGTSQDASD